MKRIHLSPPHLGAVERELVQDAFAFDPRLERDAWYAESASFGLDLKILALTVVKVLRRDYVQVDPNLKFGNLDDERRLRAAECPGGKS